MRRRQITVVFADVSGFTALAETLDAELLAGLMNGLWRRLDAVIAAFGGRVDKPMGDAVMALWGAEAVACSAYQTRSAAASRAESSSTLWLHGSCAMSRCTTV